MKIKLKDLETVLDKLKSKTLEVVEIELDTTIKGVDELVFLHVNGSNIDKYHIYDSAAGITPEITSKSKLYSKS